MRGSYMIGAATALAGEHHDWPRCAVRGPKGPNRGSWQRKQWRADAGGGGDAQLRKKDPQIRAQEPGGMGSAGAGSRSLWTSKTGTTSRRRPW